MSYVIRVTLDDLSGIYKQVTGRNPDEKDMTEWAGFTAEQRSEKWKKLVELLDEEYNADEDDSHGF